MRIGFKKRLYSALRKRDGLVCRLCGGSLEKEWELYEQWIGNMATIKGKKPFKRKISALTIDHRIPKSALRKNGATPEVIWRLSNLQLAHRDCNGKKGNNHLL